MSRQTINPFYIFGIAFALVVLIVGIVMVARKKKYDFGKKLEKIFEKRVKHF